MILAKPFPVSTAESTFSAMDGLGAVLEGAVDVAADLERLLDRDLEPCVDSASAWDMNVDLCEGVPGEPGLVTAGLSACIRAMSAAASAAVGVEAPLLPERSEAPVPLRVVTGRPLLLPSPIEDVPVPILFSFPFLDLASG